MNDGMQGCPAITWAVPAPRGRRGARSVPAERLSGDSNHCWRTGRRRSGKTGLSRFAFSVPFLRLRAHLAAVSRRAVGANNYLGLIDCKTAFFSKLGLIVGVMQHIDFSSSCRDWPFNLRPGQRFKDDAKWSAFVPRPWSVLI